MKLTLEYRRTQINSTIAIGTLKSWIKLHAVSSLTGIRSNRFSLRTLLIATTLVAVVLGLIVYLAH
jgi:hypothetical protein